MADTQRNAPKDERERFAEEMPAFGSETVVFVGGEGQDIFDDLFGEVPAIGGENEVTRRLRGRPRLDRHVGAGASSPKLNIRLSESLRSEMRGFLTGSEFSTESEFVRAAISEYIQNHRAS